MNNATSQIATPINHGRIPYLCSAKTLTGYCTNNADVKLNTGSKAILCNKHYANESGHEHLDHAGPGRKCNAPACKLTPGNLCLRVSTRLYPING